MDIWYKLMELVMLLGCAFIFGSMAQKLKQSPILGYILAGVVIGPVLANRELVTQVAELGVALLLFSIGLEFSFAQLRRMGKMAFGAGSLQILLTMGLVVLATVLSLGLPKAVATGALIALSSTTIVLRVLVDRSEMESVHGRASLAILLLQDMAIVPLVILISLLAPVGGQNSLLVHIGTLLAAVAGLVLVLYLILYQLVPRLLSSALLFANRELTVLLAVSTGLGATWAAHAAGISPALGAFVAGMLLGESPFAAQVRADIGSLRTMMVTLFFASVGMFVKPLWFVTHLHYILPAALAIFAGKAMVIYGVVRWFGLDRRHALATGIVLGQVGEFSFVLATAARDRGLMGMTAVDLIVSVTIVLMLATPYMVGYARPLSDWVLGVLSKKGGHGASSEEVEPVRAERRVILVGLGPAGRHVVQTLRAGGFTPVILDVNPVSRRFALKENLEIHLGDASQEDILHHAGLHKACMTVITVPDPGISAQIIRAVRRLEPDMPLVVRCRYNRHYQELTAAGATVIVDEEITVGEMLSRRILGCLEAEDCTLTACRLTGQATDKITGQTTDKTTDKTTYQAGDDAGSNVGETEAPKAV